MQNAKLSVPEMFRSFPKTFRSVPKAFRSVLEAFRANRSGFPWCSSTLQGLYISTCMYLLDTVSKCELWFKFLSIVINRSDMSFFLQNFDLCFKNSKDVKMLNVHIHCSWHSFVCNISSSLFILSAYRNYTDHLSHILPNTEESKSVFSALCCVRGSGKVRGHIA